MPSRFAKILVAYAGASAGVLQFVDWLVQRYMISRTLVDLLLCIALCMLPAVGLIGWYSGHEARQTGHADKRVLAVGIPLNLVLAAIVAFAVFHGKKLGATTEVVAVRDDSGALVNRRVPKTEFRKKVALFNFEGELPDANVAWLRQAVPSLLAADLDQDPFIAVSDNYDFRTLVHRAHLTIESVVPLAFARQVAELKHMDFFVTGTIKKDGNEYRLRVALNSPQRGLAVSEHEVAGADLFQLIDQVSSQLRRDLGIPAPHLETAPDLPVTEITTRSLAAFRELTLARNRVFEDDPAGTVAHLEKAVALDPTCALAHVSLFFAYYQARDAKKTQEALERTVANIYKLPEATRFYFNSIRYVLQGNADKQKAVLINWVTLYPENADAREALGDYYMQRDERDTALATYQEALAMEPSDTSILQKLVALRMQRGELDAAFANYRQYLERFPNDGDMHAALADQYRVAGRFAEARASYERALAVDPDDVNATIGLGALDFTLGAHDKAIASLEKLLGQTRLPRDRQLIYTELLDDYYKRGQMKRAFETFAASQAEFARIGVPMAVLRQELQKMRLYVLAGHADDARRTLARAAADPLAMKENINLRLSVEMAQLDLDCALEDASALAAHLPAFEATIADYGLEALRSIVLGYQARLHELRHDYAGALAAWREFAQLAPTDTLPAVGVGRCQRLVGDRDGARAELQRVVARFPAEADAHYQLALLLRETSPDDARAELTKALAIWAPADPDFKPAKEARALAGGLAIAAKP